MEPSAGFQLIAAARGAFRDDELDQLIAHCDEHAGEGLLSGGVNERRFRRSSVAWARQAEGFGWLYERLAKLANGFNRQFFGFELTGFETAVQVARYDASVSAGYDWHTDFGVDEPKRKLSISVQLSPPEAYDGGALELDVSTETTAAGRERGLVIAFPSFVRHRVSPVTRGARYSLVAWINGPRWR